MKLNKKGGDTMKFLNKKAEYTVKHIEVADSKVSSAFGVSDKRMAEIQEAVKKSFFDMHDKQSTGKFVVSILLCECINAIKPVSVEEVVFSTFVASSVITKFRLAHDAEKLQELMKHHIEHVIRERAETPQAVNPFDMLAQSQAKKVIN